MATDGSILVRLLWLVEQIPTPPPPVKRQRGRQECYSDTLCVKALLVIIIRRRYTAYALLSFLEQDDPVAQQMRLLLREHGRFPPRRTWERRFATLPARLPALIGCLGRPLVTPLRPWAAQGHAAAIDRTPLRANGGVWHKKHRLAGKSRIPRLTPKPPGASPGITAVVRLDTASGGRGRRVWIPLAAECTIARAADNVIAPKLLEQLPLAVRYVGVAVQSVQKVPISLLCKINGLSGLSIYFSNNINDFLRLSCNVPVCPLPLPR